jgi:hypothetical protein
MPWFPILLGTHIGLAISLLLPSLLLPFLLRGDAQRDEPVGYPLPVRALLVVQGTGSVIIAGALAITGGSLLVILGPEVATRPWLAVALALYAANLLVAAFVARPNLRRLLRIGTVADDLAWQRRARRQRVVAYAMAGTTGVIGFLMSVKPTLW